MNNLFEFSFLNRLLSIWCMLCFQAIVADALKSNNSARIVGGDEVPQGSGKWPFMVALLALNRETRSYKVFCGATVLNIDSIMTAAHCLVKLKPDDIIAFVGHENVLDLGNEQTQLVLASKFIVHPQFIHRYNKNDIAIIKLKWALDFTKIGNVEPVCLPQSQDDSLVDTKHCYAIGWGLNATEGQLKDILHQVELSIWDDETCTALEWDYRPYTASVMLCAGYLKGTKGPCMGDSGGPLICPLKSDRSVYVQHGIISFQDVTNGCAPAFTPSFYTRVTHYLDWIQKISKKGHDEL